MYEESAGWTQTSVLLPPDEIQIDRLFGLEIALSGERLAVSMGPAAQSTGEGPVLLDSAAVVIYKKSGGEWREESRITEPVFEPSTRNDASGFGGAIDLDGDRLAVASSGEDYDGLQDSGVVRIYERAGDRWELSAAVQPDDPSRNSGIGSRAVELDGPTLVASAGSQDSAGRPARVLVVFRETGGTWRQEAVLRPETVGERDSFGWTYDLDGDRLAVSASGRADFRGSAFVFARTAEGTWELEQEVWAEGLGPNSLFGEDVALDGDRLMVGAAGVGGEEGGVYEFRREGEEWVQVR